MDKPGAIFEPKRKTKKIISENILLHFLRKLYPNLTYYSSILRKKLFSPIRYFLYFPIKHKCLSEKNFLIPCNDCWFSPLSEFFKPKREINKLPYFFGEKKFYQKKKLFALLYVSHLANLTSSTLRKTQFLESVWKSLLLSLPFLCIPKNLNSLNENKFLSPLTCSKFFIF